MTDKFNAGDRVRIVGHDAIEDHVPYVKAYDKDGWFTYIEVPDREYIVAPTAVMPVSYMMDGGNTAFYPLSKGEGSHARKFYIAEDKLELVEDDEDEDFDDDEGPYIHEPDVIMHEDDDEYEDEDDESDLNCTKDYAQIQRNICTIAEHIADICTEIGVINETIGKLLQNK